MEYMEIAVGLVALLIAIWALNLQRKEIIKNGQISALIHTASMLQDKIEYHSRIIDDLKGRKEDWTGHAKRINAELRPLQEKVNNEFLNIASNMMVYCTKTKSEKHLKQAKPNINIPKVAEYHLKGSPAVIRPSW